jgi:ABC-2 type transport system permease protein
VTKLLNLVQNENMKIYRRLRTWILMLLLVAICGLVSFLDHYGASHLNEGDWRANYRQSIQQMQNEVQNPDIPKQVKAEMEKSIKLDQYALDHNISPMQSTLWNGVMSASMLIQIVTLFTVIITGDMVAGEFTWGTIKLLLIRPASRSKILLSKYISIILFALVLLVMLFASAVLVNGILYGFHDIGMPYLKVNSSGLVQESNLVLHVLSTYALKLVDLIMVVTLAFMISTVFRSASLAIGISIFIMFAGQAISMLLMRYSWGKYFLFANTDLTQYLQGRPLQEGMTMGFSITVLIIYFIVFNALSWSIFRKRDVAA